MGGGPLSQRERMYYGVFQAPAARVVWTRTNDDPFVGLRPGESLDVHETGGTNMTATMRLGRIAGVPVDVHWSVLGVVVLLVVGLSVRLPTMVSGYRW